MLQDPTSHDDYEWLVSDAAQPFFAAATTDSDPLSRLRHVRRQLSAERARLIVEQISLRERARAKFSAAETLFFTPRGLEQATDRWIAAYKARRYTNGTRVVDCCCGIGGDLMALAQRGPVVAVDRDPISLLLAAANCRQRSRQQPAPTNWSVETIAAEVDAELLQADDVWHIDPDRRSQGQRTTHLERFEPSLEMIDRLRERSARGGVKLAPATEAPTHWIAEAEREWISFDRQCRQQMAWFGSLTSVPGTRRATLVNRQSEVVYSLAGNEQPEVPSTGMVGRFVFDPDASILAADLLGTLAQIENLQRVSAGCAYLTADHLPPTGALAAFAVEEVMPLDLRRLKAYLRKRGLAGRLEVKKRGVPHDPRQLARQLQVPGDQAATLLLYRRGQAAWAIVAQRCATGPKDSHPVPT